MPRHLSCRFLASTAAIGLVAMGPARAQETVVRATGDQVIVNAQSMPSGSAQSTIDGVPIQSISGAVDGTAMSLDNNRLTTKARGNSATSRLSDDGSAAGTVMNTDISIGATGTDAAAAHLVVNSQEMRGDVDADIFDSGFSVAAERITNSTVAVTGNSAGASAIGNQAGNAVDLAGTSVGQGAGIANIQVAAPPATSDVAARVRRGMSISTGSVSDADLSLADNTLESYAATNAADNALSAVAGDIAAGTLADSGSAATPAGLESTASFTIANQQSASGMVKARAGTVLDSVTDGGPAFLVTATGDAGAAVLDNSRSALTATAEVNRASSATSLAAAALDGSSAAIANRQSATNARVVASTHGGSEISVTGPLDGSRLSIADTEIAAAARANAADNALTVNAATITDGSGRPRGAAAFTSDDQRDQATAGYSLLNDQAYGSSSISANQYGAAARAIAGGDLIRSEIALTANHASARGVGNTATNALDLAATTFASGAAIANAQSGDGNVIAALGEASDPSGASIVANGAIEKARLDVSDNVLSGSATGNAATNALNLKTATLLGSNSSAVAGPTDNAYGALGDIVLSSQQKLGQPSLSGALTPTISSAIDAGYGVTSARAVETAITVGSNDQRSEAIGNSTANELTVTAAQSAASPTTALSSSQYGQAQVSASSAMAFRAPLELESASVSIAGNGNVALAMLNDASNAMTVNTADRETSQGAGTAIGMFGPPLATGTVALANQQFATGSSWSSASFAIDPTLGASLSDSRLAITDNSIIAESDANRVVNSLKTGNQSAALANSQTNLAGITATASTGYEADSPNNSWQNATLALQGNAISALARGNIAANDVTLSGGPDGLDPAAAIVSASNVQADTALQNVQNNLGAVTASAQTASAALNLPTAVGSMFTTTGNSASAAAVGSAATNSIAQRSQGTRFSAAILNTQINSGAVTAIVSASPTQSIANQLGSSAMTITGNQIAATAIGNQASSAIAASR